MGRLGHARSPRLTTTPMLPFERKASPSCMGRAIVVNGRISCFASLPSLPQRAGPRCASSRIKPSHRSLIHAPSVLASFAESRTLHRVRCRQATVIALPCGAHHHKFHIGKFDAHDPTLPLIQEARRSGPLTRTSPGSAKADGAVGSRAHVAASDDHTNASFRTESQSFLQGQRDWALSHYRNDAAKRDCRATLQAAATTSRHVVIAAARSTRCDWADMRWRWTLKML
jgi:hypothetical protein